LTDAYTSRPPGSALLFDEAEAGVSNRRAMSGVNEAMRRIVGMGRVEQKYLFLTAPGVHQVDKDIRAMCDVWVFVRSLGTAQMFRVRYNPFGDHEITDDWGTLTWSADLPGSLEDTYEELTAEKRPDFAARATTARATSKPHKSKRPPPRPPRTPNSRNATNSSALSTRTPRT
jgi:hypothetical protein